MKQPDSASITRRGNLGVRLGQDITLTKGARDCMFDES
jgi:hypothetical protein